MTAELASEIGISAPTLKSFLAGGRIYDRTRASIQAYLERKEEHAG